MENRSSRALFNLAVVVLVGCLGGATGLLIGFIIFSKIGVIPFPSLFQAQPTPTVVAQVTLPAPTPTIVPTATSTLVPPTITPLALTPTPTAPMEPSPTPTRAPTRVVLPPPPTATYAPDVYVTNMRIDPTPPRQKQDLTFYVTFLNTTSFERTYHWFVRIYEEGQPVAIGQTSANMLSIIRPGSAEQASLNTWRMGPGRPCMTYVAKIHYQHPDGSIPVFAKVNGQEAAFPFTLCP